MPTGTPKPQELLHRLLPSFPEFLQTLLPTGRLAGNEFLVGDISGKPGKSLKVTLSGERAGLWIDFATGEGGDIFHLIQQVKGCDFPASLENVQQWLGTVPDLPKLSRKKTTHWHYHDTDGTLLATVTRYDHFHRSNSVKAHRKEFRVRDAKTQRWKAPNPRPLYNLAGIARCDSVVLVEGEKCAQALINKGICATTAIGGANAPVEKTDWSPLADKDIIIWPDNDKPGQDYAQRIASVIRYAGAKKVRTITIPDNKPEKWDAADALAEGMDCEALLSTATIPAPPDKPPVIPTYSFAELLDDQRPMPEDLLAPRVLTPGGILLLAGAPKVGKSDFLLNMLAAMASGTSFIGLQPPRPLRVFYLQAEVQYHYLRERVQQLVLTPEQLKHVRQNLVLTARLMQILNDDGMRLVAAAIKASFPKGVDVIVVDPIRNVFDGGPSNAGENDNDAMMFFLRDRLEKLRRTVAPDAGMILVHHTRKLSKQLVEDEPFQAFSGANALRSYYTAGMLLFRPHEKQPERHVYFELRNGAELAPKQLIKQKQGWKELNIKQPTSVSDNSTSTEKSDDFLVKTICQQASEGKIYTVNQFATAFDNKGELGGKTAIYQQVQRMAKQGRVHFFRDHQRYGLPAPGRSKFGYLCVDNMVYNCPKTGSVFTVFVETDSGQKLNLPTTQSQKRKKNNTRRNTKTGR
ncbi:AAA family ATPase [Sansalvadorimonas verongulae]|uniref:AAA family ATPase n=1 Tax=Sansalvadorimonas verongulae TaxID=2172824 RepID=UPI0012BCD513|nr:AAA family ATPase [Sansalvadorimonas verongulae]MTI15125.1 hypothetical protein [Sansalvadorimonas verongulae]